VCWTSSGCCGSTGSKSSKVWRIGWTAREKPGSEDANRSLCDRRESLCWAENRANDAGVKQPNARHRGRFRPVRTEAEHSAFPRNHCLKGTEELADPGPPRHQSYGRGARGAERTRELADLDPHRHQSHGRSREGTQGRTAWTADYS